MQFVECIAFGIVTALHLCCEIWDIMHADDYY